MTLMRAGRTLRLCDHPPDLFALPVIAYAIAVAHLLDVGVRLQAVCRLTPILSSRRGCAVRGAAYLRRSLDRRSSHMVENVRLPRLLIGDVDAELAAVRIAQRRVLETVARYGADAASHVHTADRDGEAHARSVIAALPDGVYRARDVADGDGASEQAIPVEVAVTIRGSEIEVDFTGTSPRVQRPSTAAAARSSPP